MDQKPTNLTKNRQNETDQSVMTTIYTNRPVSFSGPAFNIMD